ncbi:uncharacterized protein CLUP02_17743 [Colletotrichum lupini]|uniref:Uncharacterized protein n=1 Tax=Colletotrichum lupini TaxID=145971 RepID=A0A9Q8SFG0_9PEZI|nr:uncharacterized protein CLUP02_17743 [Colletotrichum lupini]UQC76230.1 hypothetical protein CLUP02_17743 [Colletotrichum lupini]
MSSDNKTIAITGTAGVKDPATAVYLASRGASWAISDVQLEALKAVADKLKTSIPGIRVKAAVVDISKPEKVRDCGASSQVPFEAQSDQPGEFLLGINLSGTVFFLREDLKRISDGGSSSMPRVFPI